MPVLGPLSFTLEVPSLAQGVRFYSDAGLIARVDGDTATLRCPGQDRESITLIGGVSKKRLHHISLRASQLDEIAKCACDYGGKVTTAPKGFKDDALWIEDLHGMLICLSECAADAAIQASSPFEINAPGLIVRKSRSAMRPGDSYAKARPIRLGHILVFSPDVLASVAFMTNVLGMGLADRAQEVIAFCCARKDSDHHVVAFAKSPGVGFHHGSFLVNDPDEVGRGGRALASKTKLGDWGFGRHTIGSNFFHYIQDPWGSWFEYYSDIDHIDDYAQWNPTNYDMADSLANWGPAVPHDFVHNYEADSQDFGRETNEGERAVAEK